MTDKKVTSVSSTRSYELVKGLSCDHLVSEGFFLCSTRETEGEALFFVVVVIPFFRQKRLIIQIIMYFTSLFPFKRKCSVSSNICGCEGMS